MHGAYSQKIKSNKMVDTAFKRASGKPMSIQQNENLSLNASVVLHSDEEDPGKIVRSLMKDKLKYRKAKKK